MSGRPRRIAALQPSDRPMVDILLAPDYNMNMLLSTTDHSTMGMNMNDTNFATTNTQDRPLITTALRLGHVSSDSTGTSVRWKALVYKQHVSIQEILVIGGLGKVG